VWLEASTRRQARAFSPAPLGADFDVDPGRQRSGGGWCSPASPIRRGVTVTQEVSPSGSSHFTTSSMTA